MSNDRAEENECLDTIPTVQSGELLLRRVMETVMRMMLAGSGAAVGELMFPSESGLCVRARATLQDDIAVEFGSAITSETLSLVIGRSVWHTGNPLMVNAAASFDGQFIDEIDQHCYPCIGLGLPLYCRHDLIAVLYLQSNGPHAMLSPDRRALIELMASQVAISLSSAIAQQAHDDEEQRRITAETMLHDARDELFKASCKTNTGELITLIIHELSQPLSAIDASAGAALRWLQRDLPSLDEVKLSLDKVRSCTTRAKVMIDGVRALIKQPKGSFLKFDIHAAVREVVLLSRKRIDDHRAEVILRGMDITGTVLGNRIEIQQVVQHLLDNALESMAQVNGRARLVTIASNAQSGGAIVISIADSGLGIAQESQERLFLPFATAKSRGRGIGLSVCKRIIEAHGGVLWNDNLEPHGTRFSFMLDCAHDDRDCRPLAC
jgi:signal transduction histidine kinase